MTGQQHTVDAAAAALGAEVLAIVSRAHTAVVGAVGALATGDPQPAQASLDRVLALAHEAITAKQRHVSVRELFAAIEGRVPSAAASSVGGS